MQKIFVKNEWSRNEIIAFHEMYRGDYKGSIISKPLLHLVRKYIGQKILDIGAGDGSLLKIIKTQYPKCDIEGVDLVEKELLGIKKGDCTRLLYSANTFDTVFCTEVLEHLSSSDLIKTCHEIARVMKRGSYLIITVPNEEILKKSYVFCPQCHCYFHTFGHQQTFSRSTLFRLFQTNFIPVHAMELSFKYLLKFPIQLHIMYLFRIHLLLKKRGIHSFTTDLLVVLKTK